MADFVYVSFSLNSENFDTIVLAFLKLYASLLNWFQTYLNSWNNNINCGRLRTTHLSCNTFFYFYLFYFFLFPLHFIWLRNCVLNCHTTMLPHYLGDVHIFEINNACQLFWCCCLSLCSSTNYQSRMKATLYSIKKKRYFSCRSPENSWCYVALISPGFIFIFSFFLPQLFSLTHFIFPHLFS